MSANYGTHRKAATQPRELLLGLSGLDLHVERVGLSPHRVGHQPHRPGGRRPQAVVRTRAYRSGEVDHTRTMLIAATVAVALCVAGSIGLAITSALLAARS